MLGECETTEIIVKRRKRKTGIQYYKDTHNTSLVSVDSQSRSWLIKVFSFPTCKMS